MSQRRGRSRMGVCRCCDLNKTIMARGLCRTCYGIEHAAGRLDQWPLVGYRKTPADSPPPDPDAPAAPQAIVCDWCGAALTRSRQTADEPLYELYTIAGALVAVCFEGCPADRVLELEEVSRGWLRSGPLHPDFAGGGGS